MAIVPSRQASRRIDVETSDPRLFRDEAHHRVAIGTRLTHAVWFGRVEVRRCVRVERNRGIEKNCKWTCTSDTCAATNESPLQNANAFSSNA